MFTKPLASISVFLLLAGCQTISATNTTPGAEQMVGLWCPIGATGYARNTYMEIRKNGGKFEIFAISDSVVSDIPNEVRLSSPQQNERHLEVPMGGDVPNTKLYLDPKGNLVSESFDFRTREIQNKVYLRQQNIVFPTPCDT